MRMFWFAVTMAFSIFLAGNAHAAPPATQPTKRAAERAEKIKADLKTFTLRLDFQGDEEKPYYRLLLSVPELPDNVRHSTFIGSAQITEKQAGKIVDQLLKDGFFDSALDGNRNRGPAPPDEPYYSLTVMVDNKADPIAFIEWLTLDSPLLYQRLDGLRAVLDGDAAKSLDLLIGRLSGHRKEVEKSAPAQKRP